MKNVDYSASVESRIIAEGNYLVLNNSTIRECAKIFAIPKTSVHNDLTKALPNIDSVLASKVRKVLDKNKAERALRGGLANRMKYL